VNVVLTLVVRDEADVMRANLDFHFAAGVCRAVVTDHGSEDETPAILAEYERRGLVTVIREEPGEFRKAAWVTRMARLAATDFDADWVLNADADEFWWPRGGSFAEVLDRIPSRYGVVHSFVRHFVPTRDDEAPFQERMTYRLSPDAPINDPASPWRPFQKIVHRGDPDVTVGEGSHWLVDSSLRPLRGWTPVEVLHFPVRSRAQLARKGAAWGRAVSKYYGPSPLSGPGAAYHAAAHRAAELGSADAYYDSLAPDSEAIRQGQDLGVLTVDERLRDALRALQAGDKLVFAQPSAVDEARFAADTAVLGEASVVRTLRRLDELEERLRRVESSTGVRIERGVRRLLRRRP
jgi:hypothetical protein